MAKDPAFLFYSKDWLEGTAEMLPIEKGVYIDLLCYQHQRGDLPSDTVRLARLVGMAHDEFLEVWATVGKKFKQIGERLLNERMNKVMSERSTNARKNKIIGQFSALLRKQKLSSDTVAYLKKSFKVDDFLQEDNERLNDRINEWFNERIASLANGNVNENENENNFFGKSENLSFQPAGLIPEMAQEFKQLNFRYPFDQEADLPALRVVAEKILSYETRPGSIIDPHNAAYVKRRWAELVGFIRGHPHFRNYSISQIAKHLQAIIQAYNNQSDGTANSKVDTGSNAKLGTSAARISTAKEW